MTRFTTILLVAMPIMAVAAEAAAVTSLTVQVVDLAAVLQEVTLPRFVLVTDLRVDPLVVRQVPTPLFRMEVPVLTVRFENRMRFPDRLPQQAELRLGIRAKGRMFIT